METTMASILSKIKDFIYHCKRCGQEIGFIPVTRADVIAVASEGTLERPKFGEPKPNKIFGLEVWKTEYALAIMERIKTIDLPVCRYSEAATLDLSNCQISKHEDLVIGQLRYQMEHHICADDTHLIVTFECDPWAALKKRWKWFGRRWPVKQTHVKVDGKVLYPYLNVTFPLNRHTVKWRVATI